MLKGLNSAQVEESRRLHGDNVVTPPPRESLLAKFITYLKDPLIRILLVALLLSFGIAIYEYSTGARALSVFLEPLGILVAIILATTIGFCLEISADRKFEILNRVNDDMPVKVTRDGQVQEIPRRDVVVGDIVMLDTGDEVPADGRIIDSLTLAINESTLTGEPLAHKTHIEADAEEDAENKPTYPANMAMRDTTVMEGHGIVEVTAVGDATEYGHVFKAAQIDTGIKTPLSIQLDKLGKMIAYASYVIGILIVVGRCIIFDWSNATTLGAIEYGLATLMIAITLIVVSVPEGLPMSITMSLALSMRRMLATNNLVRKMHACETMGATTVICTDKTGTLTQNRMSVHAVDVYGDRAVLDEGIAANTSAFLDYSGESVRTVGNPTECALLLWLHEQGVDYMKLREGVTVEAQIPFTTRLKYMATEVQSAALGKRVVYIKGAPEIVLAMCAEVAGDVDRKAIENRLQQYQSQAMRTLGFAYGVIDGQGISKGEIRADLKFTFIGICAISDPVRAEVPDAIRSCLDAGIKVKIVTGDTVGTATEVGRQVGLYHDDKDAVITGPEWAALSDEEALRRVDSIKIMSRARPADKQRLVSMLQKRGEVVAVTGDGTNDAPALNAAQVGLAMGDGTAVAKEAGDIVIMDNSFASISKAVMWGRSLYQNIRRFIIFQLTVNVAACLIVLIGAFTGVQSPLTVTQMLWVNLIMDTFAALALSSLPPSEDVLKDKPRRSDEFIITRPMANTIIGAGLLFTVILYAVLQYFRVSDISSLMQFNILDCCRALFSYSDGLLSDYDLTLFFTIFVFIQAWNLMNVRTFGSRHTVLHDARDSRTFFGTLAAIVVGQILIVYCGGEMFNVVPISVTDFALIVVATSPVYLVPMLVKMLRK